MSDFTNIVETEVLFGETDSSDTVDFIETGDAGLIIVEDTSGWDDDWGEDWGGGTQTVTISSPTTVWTNVETP